MRWDPERGHVPRGFAGATGDLSEVELVLVFAEPGDPQPGEQHTGLASAYAYANSAFEREINLFHRNTRFILDQCWPGVSYADQLKRVWLTESVLCSARVEGGRVSSGSARACVSRYLRPQLELLSSPIIGALGSKAQQRLRAVGITDFIPASAVAPPGCNFRGARESWLAIAAAVRARSAG
jgi:hypothetical protein